MAISWEELTHWKRPWCLERLKAEEKGDDRVWDSWMASLTQRTWVWGSSGWWWWTGKPGMLQSMESQTVWQNWATTQQQKCLRLWPKGNCISSWDLYGYVSYFGGCENEVFFPPTPLCLISLIIFWFYFLVFSTEKLK